MKSYLGSAPATTQQKDVHIVEAAAGGHVRRQTEELFEAAAKGDRAVFDELPVQQLLQALTLRNEDGRSLLHVAAAAGHSQVVSIFSDGVEPTASGINASDDEGWTPLHSAVSCGNGAVTEVLLRSGADVHIANAGGQTALYYAASKGHSQIFPVGSKNRPLFFQLFLVIDLGHESLPRLNLLVLV